MDRDQAERLISAVDWIALILFLMLMESCFK